MKTKQSVSSLPYLLSYCPFLVIFFSAYMGGLWTYLVPFLAFGAVPAADLVIGEDNWNPTKEEERELSRRMSFRYVTWCWFPVQLFVLLWTAHHLHTKPVSMCDWFGLTLSLGVCGGLGINCAHELIHKPSQFEQTLGKLILVSLCYGHFYVEHLWGHHKMVSTPEDPASSHYGESIYQFWPRTVVGSFRSAWKIETTHLASAGHGPWTYHNQILHFVGGSVGIAGLLGVKYGVWGVLFFVMQSCVAFGLLEVVNYIEHYGLERRRKTPGEYVNVGPGHSWNAGHRVTNYFLFKLQRHSDHHAFAGRRYQILRTFKSSPQMPTGYAGMIVLALFPPLWFRVMNPLVLQVRKRLEEEQQKGSDMFSLEEPSSASN